jgi:hypothetical protein
MIPEFKFKGEPLSRKESEQLLVMIMNKNKEKDISENKDLSEVFTVKIFLKRKDAFNLPFSITDFFVGMSSKFLGKPGTAITLLWLCFCYYKKTGKRLLDINDWCLMFPWGLPTDKELEAFWDSQKGPEEPLGNMIDNPEYWMIDNPVYKDLE